MLGTIIVPFTEKVFGDHNYEVLTSSRNGLQRQSEHFAGKQRHDTDGYNIIPRGYCTYRNRSDDGLFTFNMNNIVDEGIVSKFYPVFTFQNANSTFMMEYLNGSPRVRAKLSVLAVGTSQVVLSFETLKETSFYLPTFEEQNRIAALLSTLNKRIEKQRLLIEHLKKYKRGFLQASFSSQDDWNTYPISSLGKVVTGSTPPTDNPENYGGDELFCAPSDVGAEKYISSTIKRVSEKGFHTGRIVPKGTIIVTCIGLIGKLGIAMQDMITNQQINSLIVDDAFDNEFIYYALEFTLPRYAAQASMQTMPILSKSEFEKITLPIPNIKRQKEISKPLALLDNKIFAECEILDKLITLKNGLLQNLFI